MYEVVGVIEDFNYFKYYDELFGCYIWWLVILYSYMFIIKVIDGVKLINK